jgi:nicotinamidase-related amidase
MQTALLVIDMQQGMADRLASGRDHANPEAMARIADLLALFRDRGLPVIHVHHADPDPGSPFHAGQPGAVPIAGTGPRDGETVLVKSGSSAFSGTGLDGLLKARGIGRIVVAGAVAAYCVTSTSRAASDLGYNVIVPSDAVMSFDIAAEDGGRIPAAEVLRTALSLLFEDFALVMPAARVAAQL